MSKAEEKAMEKYPPHSILIVPARDGGYYADSHLREGFIEGYHQAEKDLDISWVKEVSGVKDMSRAKEEALKAYPPQSIAANYDTINRRDAFEYGYLKAEKDLELTWKDISKIISIDQQVCGTMGISDYTHNHQQAMEEVLKRFKDYKEREQQ